jgi:putative transposase
MWTAFLNEYVRDLVSIDCFVVPTVRFTVLFVLVICVHHRRTLVRLNLTEHPTAQWTGQQIIEALGAFMAWVSTGSAGVYWDKL